MQVVVGATILYITEASLARRGKGKPLFPKWNLSRFRMTSFPFLFHVNLVPVPVPSPALAFAWNRCPRCPQSWQPKTWLHHVFLCLGLSTVTWVPLLRGYRTRITSLGSGPAKPEPEA
ncbi:hypothetical protein BGY98DRAFT_224816 [Russula aff. rugulosa BPL654]|nr:hypothetical protein BGY98DRAFT_284460 [Russula aff. rugulosa BPL654]KAI0270946.1 hypothetical protein BGY98DRAFT_224816 [Russula aff. rugulosa BPL654]